MTPYYETELGKLYHGDCLEIMPELEPVDLVLTDPPYGIGVNTKWKIRKPGQWAKDSMPIKGDNKPFNPKPFLFKNTILWGGNHYASRLPDSPDWLCWDKRRQGSITRGWNAPDFELAWSNIKCGARYFQYLWEGYKRDGEIGKHFHPTQKPIRLMEWCIELSKTSGIICDPFLGSGTTAIACERLKRKWIGIEIEEKYCEIAAKRIEQERKQLKLF